MRGGGQLRAGCSLLATCVLAYLVLAVGWPMALVIVVLSSIVGVYGVHAFNRWLDTWAEISHDTRAVVSRRGKDGGRS